VQIKVLTVCRWAIWVRYLGSEHILAGDATLAFLTRCIQVPVLLKRSEAPWASSDQPNARGFSSNSLNKQASRCSPVPGAEYQARIRKSAKTITIIRSREHSDPGLGKDGLQLVPLGAPISTGARSEGSILSHPQATCLRCSVVVVLAKSTPHYSQLTTRSLSPQALPTFLPASEASDYCFPFMLLLCQL